jgi:hypothetical protein
MMSSSSCSKVRLMMMEPLTSSSSSRWMMAISLAVGRMVTASCRVQQQVAMTRLAMTQD